jgi:hypothetical protein
MGTRTMTRTSESGTRISHSTYCKRSSMPARRAGIDVQIYVSCGWDQLMTHRHPEWRRVGSDGQFVCFHGKNLEAAWYEVCFNTAYLDYLCDQIREVVTKFPAAMGSGSTSCTRTIAAAPCAKTT